MALWDAAHCFRLLRLALQCNQHVGAIVELYFRLHRQDEFLCDLLEITLGDMASVWPQAIISLDTLFCAVHARRGQVADEDRTTTACIAARHTLSLASAWHPRSQKGLHLALLACHGAPVPPTDVECQDTTAAVQAIVRGASLADTLRGIWGPASYYRRFITRWSAYFTRRATVLYAVNAVLWVRSHPWECVPPTCTSEAPTRLDSMTAHQTYILDGKIYAARELVHPDAELTALLNREVTPPTGAGPDYHNVYAERVMALGLTGDLYALLTAQLQHPPQPCAVGQDPPLPAPPSLDVVHSPKKRRVAHAGPCRRGITKNDRVVYLTRKKPGKKLTQSLYFASFPRGVLEKGPYVRQAVPVARMEIFLQAMVQAAGLTSTQPQAVMRGNELYVQTLYQGNTMDISRHQRGAVFFADMRGSGLMRWDVVLEKTQARGIPEAVERRALLHLCLSTVLEVRERAPRRLTAVMDKNTVFQTGGGGVFSYVRYGERRLPTLLTVLLTAEVHDYLRQAFGRHRPFLEQTLREWQGHLAPWITEAWPGAGVRGVSLTDAITRAGQNLEAMLERDWLARPLITASLPCCTINQG